MTVDLRGYTTADTADLVEVFVAAWQSGYPGIVPVDVLAAVDEPTVAGWFADWRGGTLTTTVAEVDGAVVGFARYGDDPDTKDPATGHLAALYVHPGAAGRGIGRRLIERAFTDLARHGRRVITLWVFRDNDRARGLYRRMGFTEDGAELTDPRWRTPQVRMRRALGDVPDA